MDWELKKTAAFRQLSKSVFKESSKFSFPSGKGTDFRVSRYWIFFGFRQDNEGFRDRQHFFFKVLDSISGLIFRKLSVLRSGFQRISSFGFSSDVVGFQRTNSFGSSSDLLGFQLWALSFQPWAFLVFLRTLMVFFGSDHSRASTIQRCEEDYPSHKLFDRTGESFDFRGKTDDNWKFGLNFRL